MRDGELVAAIVGGNPDGLAETYDKYAAGLFGYCRTLLHEPADAADAVQDTFVIAASKLAELRDPERLRPWLYAVARNECHRRLRAGKAAAALDETADMADESADVSDAAERAQLRDLVRSAITGLNPGDQEVIELSLRHELEGADLADALGVPRNHAHALVSRARDQLVKSLGALLVARSGRQTCLALDDLLKGWDGRMTVLMRKRVNRHIDRCEVCGERKRRELAPAMLLGMAPLAVLPEALKAQVLRLVSGGTPEAAAQRASIVQHAGTFGQNGFPAPIDPLKVGPRWKPSHGQAAAAGGAATGAAALTVAVALALSGSSGGKHHTLGAAGSGSTGSQSGPPSPGRPGPSGQGGKPGRPGKQPHPGQQPPAAAGAHGTPGGSGAAGAAQGSGAPGSGAPGGGGSSSGGSGGSGRGGTGGGGTGGGGSGSGSGGGTGGSGGSGGGGTGGGGSGGGGSGGGGSGGGTGPTTPPGGGGSPPPPPVNAGTVTASPGSLLLVASVLGGPAHGTLTLTAGNAPVPDFTVTVPSSLLGKVSVSPASGSLAAGQSTQVTVTVSSLLSLDTHLVISPGGQSVTVLLGASVGLAPAAPGVQASG
ncbi:MAG TPA: sigma-70 family RNA polymerase sigma factor [Streptosporangiaceae bacterium]|nr:sigma-70 family RNA polymerase sigma factor [Streptosporangiaceae bacterium]